MLYVSIVNKTNMIHCKLYTLDNAICHVQNGLMTRLVCYAKGPQCNLERGCRTLQNIQVVAG